MSEQRADTMDTPPKIVLIAVIVVCLVGLFIAQSRLNNQRGELSPTYLEPLQDAPPMLALTTQALGGFRGLISSYLWLRANEMQLKKKYQEQMQLSEWVAQLQPHVSMVWQNRAWNMANDIKLAANNPSAAKAPSHAKTIPNARI